MKSGIRGVFRIYFSEFIGENQGRFDNRKFKIRNIPQAFLEPFYCGVDILVRVSDTVLGKELQVKVPADFLPASFLVIENDFSLINGETGSRYLLDQSEDGLQGFGNGREHIGHPTL